MAVSRRSSTPEQSTTVIPGRRVAAGPESITTAGDYRFRAPSLRSGPGMTAVRWREPPQSDRRPALARRGLGQRMHQLGRRQRRLVEFDAQATQGIVHRIEDGGRRRDGAAFADALDAI